MEFLDCEENSETATEEKSNESGCVTPTRRPTYHAESTKKEKQERDRLKGELFGDFDDGEDYKGQDDTHMNRLCQTTCLDQSDMLCDAGEPVAEDERRCAQRLITEEERRKWQKTVAEDERRKWQDIAAKDERRRTKICAEDERRCAKMTITVEACEKLDADAED